MAETREERQIEFLRAFYGSAWKVEVCTELTAEDAEALAALIRLPAAPPYDSILRKLCALAKEKRVMVKTEPSYADLQDNLTDCGKRIDELESALQAEREARLAAAAVHSDLDADLAAERARTRGQLTPEEAQALLNLCEVGHPRKGIALEQAGLSKLHALSALVDEGRAVDETADGNEGG